jgi:hypothetical protein
MRTRSPIEMMVDQACGFDPNAPTPPRPPVVADDPQTQLVCDACTAVAAWAAAVDDNAPTDEVAEKKRQALAAGRALVAAGW